MHNCVHDSSLCTSYTSVFLFLSFFHQQKKPSGTMSSADWVLDPVELEAAFSEKTKAIIVNTPNNPLGKVKPWVNFHLSETVRKKIEK